MAKALSNAEIEEEIINNDLLNSGGLEDENTLHEMNIEEKKELLKGINKSKEESRSEVRSGARSPSTLDSSHFPALGTPGRIAANQRALKLGLKLPRKTPSASGSGVADVISLVEDDEDVPVARFCLPGTISDNALPLKMPPRPKLKVECPMYRMEGETNDTCLRRMLQFHDAWRRAYDAELRKQESQDLNDEEESEITADVYEYKSDSPLQVSKVYGGAKGKGGITATTTTYGSRPRRANPDFDTSPILKPDEPKGGEWISASSSRHRNKRNRKQLGSEQEQTTEREGASQPDVDFSFDKKWDSGSAQWQATAVSPSLNNSVGARRSLRSPLVEEKKVECPLCQKLFPMSKVENHAANCEGYSGDPMDVEEGN